LRAKSGEMQSAFELLLIALNHPACDQETKNRADHLRAELEARLTRQQVEAAERWVTAKTFEAVVEEILQQAPAPQHQMAD
jgi:MoxR-like ATPase